MRGRLAKGCYAGPGRAALEVELIDHLREGSRSAVFTDRCGEPNNRPMTSRRAIEARGAGRPTLAPPSTAALRRAAAESSWREAKAEPSSVTILGAEPYTG
jgi:hypothetical protein